MGHAKKKAISEMSTTQIVDGMNLHEKPVSDVCEPCREGKMTNATMKSRTNLSTTPGASIHTDVAHMNIQSLGGARYFVTFTDEMTGHISTVPIKQKNEAST